LRQRELHEDITTKNPSRKLQIASANVLTTKKNQKIVSMTNHFTSFCSEKLCCNFNINLHHGTDQTTMLLLMEASWGDKGKVEVIDGKI
jgi:hypothetical protein